MSTEHQIDSPISEEPSSKVSSEERREILSRTLQTQLVDGYRIESQSDYFAVVVKPAFRIGTHKYFHFLIGLSTIGVWWLIWPFIKVALQRREKRATVTIDEFGNPLVQRL